MEFTKAKKGTKLILIGEILLIVGLITTICATALMAFAGTASEGAAMISTILFMAAAGVAFAAQVLVIIGLIIAGMDESTFRISLIFTILCILCDSASGFLQSMGSVPVMIATALSAVVFAAAVCFGLKAIANLSEKAGNTELCEKSRKTKMSVIIVTLISVILTIAGGILEVAAQQVTLSTVLSALASLMSVLVVILYITVLSKTKEL